MAHLFTQPQQKLQLNYKTNIMQNIRKLSYMESDNQGIKEVTFIQTGRRGREAEQAGPTPTCGG